MSSTQYELIFKFVVIGDMSVGKSSLLKQFQEQSFTKDSPHTIGVEFGTRIVEISGKKVKLQIWDTAGQERFRAVTRSYYRGAAGALMIYDITRRSTFNNIATWLTDARNLTSPNTVMMMIGNQIDRDKEREVTYEEAEKFAKENNLIFLETSAMTGENVEEAFLKTARTIYEHIQDGSLDVGGQETGVRYGKSGNNNQSSSTVITSSSSNSKPNGGCCG